MKVEELLAELAAYGVGEEHLTLTAIRAQGAGGQNVNKVSSAIHLRFDSAAAPLPPGLRERLMQRGDQRIGKDGVIVIKAQEFRQQEQNRAEALRRLAALLAAAAVPEKTRHATRPTRSSQKKRLEMKRRHASIKAGRRSTGDDQ